MRLERLELAIGSVVSFLVCGLVLMPIWIVASTNSAAEVTEYPGSFDRYRPSALVLLFDDVGFDLLASSCTPNIDSVAANGASFTRYYTNPLCSPSRGQLFTGQHAFRTGLGAVVFDSPGMSLSVPTLPQMMPQAHTVGMLGKYHLASNLPGFETHAQSSGWDVHAGSWQNISDYFDWTKRINGIDNPSTNYATTDTAFDALAFIAMSPEPWLTVVSFNAAHTPWQEPPLAGCSMKSGDRGRAERMLENADELLAPLLTAARSHGAYIFVLSDNGTPRALVEPPLDPDHAKGTVYQGGVNVPAFVEGPGIPAGLKVHGLASAVDVPATLLDFVGTAPGQAIDGASWVPYFQGKGGVRSHAYVERFRPNQEPNTVDYTTVSFWEQAVINDANWKLVRVFGAFDDEELYDLTTDPLELTDRIGDPGEAQAQLQDLRAELVRLGL